MIRHAATNTQTRRDRIMQLLNTINHNQSETIQGFGVKVDDKFLKLKAR